MSAYDLNDDTRTIWVCTDCYFAYHNGDYTPTDAATPFSLFDLSDGAPAIWRYVTPGLFAADHADDCAFHISGGYAECTYEGDCEHVTFSWQDCGACNSPLGGDRYAMTVWEAGNND